MHTPRLVFIVGTLAASLAFANWSQQGDGEASFKATGPAGFKIVGTTKKVATTDDGKNVTVAIKLADIDTDNSLRNKHMLEDLEAEKQPDCSLTVPSASIKDDGKEQTATGTFALHGKTKEIPFKYTVSCKENVCTVDGSADLNLKDYDVKVRSYLGITVKPEVSVTTKFTIKK